MILCPHCGTTNQDEDKFCRSCGEPLPIPTADGVICPRCEAENAPGSVFCDECGARLQPTPSTGPEPEPEQREPIKGLSLPKKQTGELRFPPALQIDQEIPEEVPPWLEDMLLEHGLLEPEEEEPPRPDRLTAPPAPQSPVAEPETEGEVRPAAMPEMQEEPPPEEEVETLPPDDWLQALRATDEDGEEIAKEPIELESAPAPSPAETPPKDEEEMPDWLRDLETLAEEDEEPSAETDALPDWLEDLRAEEEEPSLQEQEPPPAEPSAVEMEEEELPAWLRDLGAPEDSEAPLAPEGKEPGPPVEQEAEPGAEEQVPPLVESPEIETEEAVPDWLSDLDAPGEVPPLAEAPESEGEPEAPSAVAEEGPEEMEERELPEWLVDLREGEMEQEIGVAPPEPAGEAEEPDETPEDKETPGWLQDLQPPDDEELTEKGPDAHPDWLTQPTTPDVTVEEGEVMAPDWLQGPVPADADESEEREDAPPDWLQDLESEAAPLVADEEESIDELASRLDQPEPTAEAPQEEVSPFVDDGLEEMLGAEEEFPAEGVAPQPEVEPEEPKEDREDGEGLARAEIPEWLLALRPEEADEEIPADAEIEELAGPLKGIKGVLPAEPIIAKPHLSRAETVPVEAPHVPGDLFAEIVAQPPQPVAAPPRKKRSRAVAGIQRVLIYLLILAAVVVPLFVDPFQYGPLDAQDLQGGAGAFYPLLEGAGPVALPTGSVVVVAFDYHPATAGELSVQAQAVVDHLMARGLRVAAISLYPEGAALALDILEEQAGVHGYEYGADYIHLGYLPNQPASVRHFLDAGPASAIRRDYRSGEPLDRDQYPIVQAIEDMGAVSLVVELTGDERTLRTWVEQITARARVPIAAGVSASIAPYAQPYLDSGQLEALLVGLPGAAEYEAQRKQVGQGIRSLGSQVAAQAMVVLLILLGNLVHLATRGGKQ